MTVWVLLPAYNEEQAIGPEIRDICTVLEGLDHRVVVVDDGSGDRTAALAEGMAGPYPVEVLRHPVNRGLGQALATGLRYIVEEGSSADAVVLKDADGTHPASLVPPMLERLARGADVVVASRYRAGARQRGLGYSRKLLSLLGNAAYSLVARAPGVRDYTSGFRVYRLEILKRASRRRRLVESEGFGATPELLLKVGAVGAHVAEVPLVLRYDQKTGPSKMRLIRTLRESLRLLWHKS